MSFLKTISEKKASLKPLSATPKITSSHISHESIDSDQSSTMIRASTATADFRKMSSPFKTMQSKASASGMNLMDVSRKDMPLLSFLNYSLDTVVPVFEPKKLSSLQKAVYENDVKKITKLLGEKDRNADKMDSEHGFTALFLAVLMNLKDIVVLLLDTPNKKVNINSINTALGRTPLMMAIINDRYDIVDLLLTKDANLDIKDAWKCSAVFFTLLNSDASICQKLIARGAVLDQLDKFNRKAGETVLHHAARLGKTDIMKLLCDSGVDIEIPNEYIKTPLHVAVKSTNANAAKWLIQAGANVFAKDGDGETAVDYLRSILDNKDLKAIIENAVRRINSSAKKSQSPTARFSLIPEEAGYAEAGSIDLNEFTGSQMISKYDVDMKVVTSLLETERTANEKKDKLIKTLQLKNTNLESSLNTAQYNLETTKNTTQKLSQQNEASQVLLIESLAHVDALTASSLQAEQKTSATALKQKEEILTLQFLNKEASSTHKKLIVEIADYISLIEDKEHEINSLKDTVRTSMGSQSIAFDTELQLSKSVAENASLQRMIKALGMKEEEHSAAIEEMSTRLYELGLREENSTKDAEKYKNQLLSINSEKTGAVSIMQQQLDEFAADRDEYVASLASMKEARSKLEAKIVALSAELETAIESQQISAVTKDSDIDEISQQRDILTQEIKRLTAASTEHQHAIHKLKFEYADLEQLQSDSSAAVIVKEEQLSESRIKVQSLADYKEKYEALQHTLLTSNDSTSRALVLEQQCHEAKTRLQIVESDLLDNELTIKRQAIEAKFSAEASVLLTRKYGDLEKKLTELSSEVLDYELLRKQIGCVYEGVKDLLIGMSAPTLTDGTVTLQIKYLQSVVEFLNDTVDALNVEARERQGDLENEVNASKYTIQKREARITALQKEIDDMGDTAVILTQKLVIIETACDELRKQREQSMQEHKLAYEQNIIESEVFDSRIASLSTENSSLKTKLSIQQNAHTQSDQSSKGEQEVQTQKILKAYEEQRVRFNALEESQRVKHSQLIDNYETHIKILASEVGHLRLETFKNTIENAQKF